MLDPITITTSIGALLKAAYSIAVELKSFRDSITIVQEKLDGLLQDVEALASVLTSMRDTFEGITAGVGTDNIGKHWQDISRALENGKETLAQLHECLQEVNRTSKIMDAPRKQLRLTFATDRLALFRQHVQSYRDALQLSLQTVILWTQVSQKKSTDLILPSLREELRRVASVLNQRIEALHGMIASQMPKESQRDSQWQDESQMVAMCILRDCVSSAITVVSTASTKLGSDHHPDAEVSIRAVDSDLGDLLPRRSMVMLQRYVESRTAHEYGHGSSPPERRSLASVSPFESDSNDYPDSDYDLEAEITTTLVYKARKILLSGTKVHSERSRAERYLKNCLSRLTSTNSAGQSYKTAESRRIEIDALDLLTSIYCDNAQWSDARVLLTKKMALKERFCSRDDSSLAADVLLFARLLLADHEYVEAYLQARRALKAYRKINDAEGSSESLQVLVSICRSDNREDDADAFEAVLTELYPDDALSADIGVMSGTHEATKPDIGATPTGDQSNSGASSSPEHIPSITIDSPSTGQTPINLSHSRQHNLADVISNAKFAARLSTRKAGITRNRKPKLIPREANERGPILKLPPSPVKEEEEKDEDGRQQQQKPKLIPRGANERAPIIEIPPFPEEKEQQPKLIPRGANEREPVLELPPFPGDEKHSPWDSTRLWPKRKRSITTAKRVPHLPIELVTSLNDAPEAHLAKTSAEQTPITPQEPHAKSVETLAGRSSEESTHIPVSQSVVQSYVRRSMTSMHSMRNSRTSAMKGSQAAPLSPKESKPTLSRLEAAARSTLYDDQWLRRNRAWLIALINYTESNATPQPSSESTSDLLSGFSFSSHFMDRDPSRPNSIASSEALTPSLRLVHPALRPGRSFEKWI